MQYRVVNTGTLLELQRRLERAGGARLRRNLQRRVRRAATPLHRDLQDAIRRTPITGRGGGGSSRPSRVTRPLRDSIAGAIRLSLNSRGADAGARIWIDKGRLPRDIRNLPPRIEEGHWRHPVFGNRSNWTDKYSRPWWGPTLRAGAPRTIEEIARVLNDIRDELS